MYQISSSLNYRLHKMWVHNYNNLISRTPAHIDIVSSWPKDVAAQDIYYGVSTRFFAWLTDERGTEVIRNLLDLLENEQPTDADGVFKVLSSILGTDAESFIRAASFRSYRLHYLLNRCTNNVCTRR